MCVVKYIPAHSLHVFINFDFKNYKIANIYKKIKNHFFSFESTRRIFFI